MNHICIRHKSWRWQRSRVWSRWIQGLLSHGADPCVLRWLLHSSCFGPVDLAGWKWVGAMAMGRVTQYCYTPNSRKACKGLSHVSDLMAFQSLQSYVCGFSTSPPRWASDKIPRTRKFLLSHRLKVVHLISVEAGTQCDCCIRERACFHCAGMCLFSWKYSSDVGGVVYTSSCWKSYRVSAAFCSCSAHLEARFSGFLHLVLLLIHLLCVTNIHWIYTNLFAFSQTVLLSQFCSFFLSFAKTLHTLLNFQ